MKYNINTNYYLNKFINKIKNNNNYIKDSNYLIYKIIMNIINILCYIIIMKYLKICN